MRFSPSTLMGATMNAGLLKLAQTFVASTLIVAVSSCVSVNQTAPVTSASKSTASSELPVAQAGYVRIRGAITAVAADAITVRTRTGQELRIKLGKTPVNAI